jgi:hypothetical protein
MTGSRFAFRPVHTRQNWKRPSSFSIAASMLIYPSGSGSSTEATFGVRGATPGNEGPSQWRENRPNVPSLYSSTSSTRTVAGAPTAGFPGTCWAVSMVTLPHAHSSKNRTAQLQKNPVSLWYRSRASNDLVRSDRSSVEQPRRYPERTSRRPLTRRFIGVHTPRVLASSSLENFDQEWYHLLPPQQPMHRLQLSPHAAPDML